ncbi:MAG: hypothetical protein AAGF83_13120 [Cyanobacteria bacterium P01_G01_bin.67]
MINNQAKIKFLILALVSITFSLAPVTAQTARSQSNFLTDIEAGNYDDWEFSSEDESISIKDEITELQEYNLSNLSESEIELEGRIVKDRTWGNRGDVEDFSVKTDVYEY